jgi:hypothetical protein
MMRPNEESGSMGKIISLAEYRRKRCLEALMLEIGLPDYCDECGENIEALLLADEDAQPAEPVAQPLLLHADMLVPARRPRKRRPRKM